MLLILVASHFVDPAFATAPEDPAQIIKQAEITEPSNHVVYDALLRKLDAMADRLTPKQQWNRRYLAARQVAFAGHFDAAMPLLEAIGNQTQYPVVAFRANATVIDVLVAQSRYEKAFAKLNPLLDQLPQVTQIEARLQGLSVATNLYAEGGQYEAAIKYADLLLKDSVSAKDSCMGWHDKINAQLESGDVQFVGDDLQKGSKVCDRAGGTLFALGMKQLQARWEVRQGHLHQAADLLQKNYPQVLHAGFPPQVSEYEATIAHIYFLRGNLDKAKAFAQRALTSNANRPYSESTATAYDTLYQIEKKRGHSAEALSFHEKYTDADEGFKSRLSAKSLAYQVAQQRVLARKLQMDQLDKKNKLLMMQAQMDRKAIHSTQVYVALLSLLLLIIGFLTYRIKRSQLRFMKLAQRDGLTGIFNRQHFVNAAERELQYRRKSGRLVSLVLIDLDHFKLVNDTHGHHVGDRVLKRAVAACQAHLRSTDVFGRLGGEEFGILMPECELDQVINRVELMRMAIASSSVSDDLKLQVSASFGISCSARSGYEVRQLLIDADEALYRSKREGRDRVSVSEKSATLFRAVARH